jgi:hypothetical protein
MKFSWGRVVALIAATSVMFGATACGDPEGETAGSATTKPADPKEALLGSLATYEKGVYAVTFTALDGTGQGKVDSTKKHAYLKMTSTDPEAKFTMELLVLEPDTYLKMDMGELAAIPGLELLSGEKWMHVDRSKIKDADELGLKGDDTDLLRLKALLQNAQSVQEAGDRKYSGTLDLGKGTDSPVVDEEVLEALGATASTVPFTATVDAEGRLTELLIEVPAAGDSKAHQLKMTLSEYGAVTLPAKPTGGDVVEAPANVYEILNS